MINKLIQTNLDFDGIASKLRIPPAGQVLCTDWDAAMQVSPAESLPLLEPEFITRAGQAVGLTDEMIKELVSFAEWIATDEAVVAFFSFCRYIMLYDKTMTLSWEEKWPPLDEYLGEQAGLLNVLVMLSVVPEMQATYRRLGIPTDILMETVADMKLWMETDIYYLRYKRWGFTPWIARWLYKHWHGELLQFGRLQFSMGAFEGKLYAYRHRQTGQVLAISDAGIRYRADGDICGPCCGESPDDWISTLAYTKDAVIGNPIFPNAVAQRQTRKLALEEWELVLSPGDKMLTMHVPAGGPLNFAECGESFRRALEAFPRYFPEFHFRGFWTKSWLMDPRLSVLLPSESNIARMQRELYLFPVIQGDNQQIYHRVFGWGVTDINAVPWKSSLQKSIGEYLNNGGHFHGGYCFLLKDDFAWGEQVYVRTVK